MGLVTRPEVHGPPPCGDGTSASPGPSHRCFTWNPCPDRHPNGPTAPAPAQETVPVSTRGVPKPRRPFRRPAAGPSARDPGRVPGRTPEAQPRALSSSARSTPPPPPAQSPPDGREVRNPRGERGRGSQCGLRPVPTKVNTLAGGCRRSDGGSGSVTGPNDVPAGRIIAGGYPMPRRMPSSPMLPKTPQTRAGQPGRRRRRRPAGLRSPRGPGRRPVPPRRSHVERLRRSRDRTRPAGRTRRRDGMHGEPADQIQPMASTHAERPDGPRGTEFQDVAAPQSVEATAARTNRAAGTRRANAPSAPPPPCPRAVRSGWSWHRPAEVAPELALSG